MAAGALLRTQVFTLRANNITTIIVYQRGKWNNLEDDVSLWWDLTDPQFLPTSNQYIHSGTPGNYVTSKPELAIIHMITNTLLIGIKGKESYPTAPSQAPPLVIIGSFFCLDNAYTRPIKSI